MKLVLHVCKRGLINIWKSNTFATFLKGEKYSYLNKMQVKKEGFDEIQ